MTPLLLSLNSAKMGFNAELKTIQSQVINKLKGVHWMNAKAKPDQAYVPTTIEHVANVMTHGVWVAPSIYACTTLVQRSASWPQYWSALIYGAALILLFTISTFFHSVFFCSRERSGKMGQLKDLLHRGDRAMIYVFIAASYFPWLTLRPLPPDGWAAELRWVVWLLASLGILYQQLYHEQYKWLETLFYLVMGIAPSIAILSMSDFSGLTELKIGGVIYILGVFFFKADGCIPCAHAIWHIHVVCAAGVHYYAILKYLYMQ
ncbi:monocyte to macrophage differentiation factor 2 isoform X2 [Hetaerina americana]|uniref:monocyte to macrophage differentiation factor 2 isoform X2 n=1 Tax=Hetaerina americana TaxID=62018 RepID=UPI003A7F1926